MINICVLQSFVDFCTVPIIIIIIVCIGSLVSRCDNNCSEADCSIEVSQLCDSCVYLFGM